MKIESTLERARRYYTKEISIVKNPLESRAIMREEHELLLTQYDPFNVFSLIWSLLWDSGMRPIEVCRLNRENFNDDYTKFGYKIGKPKTITRDGKVYVISNARIIDLSPDLSSRLKVYAETSNLPYGYMFPARVGQGRDHFHMPVATLNNEMDRKRKVLGGRFLLRNHYGHHLIAPHSYRRSWITRWVNQQKDSNPFETARCIGHQDPRTTMTYFQYSENLKNKVRQFIHDNAVKVNKQSSEFEM